MRYRISFEVKEEDSNFILAVFNDKAVINRIVRREIKVDPILEDVNMEIRIDLPEKFNDRKNP
jgi:hypothetical protein